MAAITRALESNGAMDCFATATTALQSFVVPFFETSERASRQAEYTNDPTTDDRTLDFLRIYMYMYLHQHRQQQEKRTGRLFSSCTMRVLAPGSAINSIIINWAQIGLLEQVC